MQVLSLFTDMTVHHWRQPLTSYLDVKVGNKKTDRYVFFFPHGESTRIALTVRFEDEQSKVQRYEKLKRSSWMDLLRGERIPEELRDFDNPKWDKRVTGRYLPPGWETRISPSRIVYFADHNTKTTSWELPERP